MAIDVNEITSDITLEVDEEVIAIHDFTKAFENFFGLVKEVSREISPGKNASAWTVTVYPGSAGVGVSRVDGVFSLDEANSIRSALIDGLKTLSNGMRPIQFTDKAIEYSKNIASLYKGRPIAPNIKMWAGKAEAIPVTRQIAVSAGDLLNPAYEEDGTVDGVLEKLDSHGKLQFVIYDVIDDRSVKCEVTEEQVGQAWESWRKRVEVIGRVRYRKDGMPVSVKASRIVPFPGASEIPSLEQMRSLLSGA